MRIKDISKCISTTDVRISDYVSFEPHAFVAMSYNTQSPFIYRRSKANKTAMNLHQIAPKGKTEVCIEKSIQDDDLSLARFTDPLDSYAMSSELFHKNKYAI